MNLERDTAYYVALASRAFTRMAESRLRPLGVGVAHIKVMTGLADTASMSQREIAAYAHIEQPTAAALIQRMDAAGLIDRAPDPSDRRSTQISLSSLGAELLPEALALRSSVVAEATASFTAAEVKTLNGLLARLLVNLDSMVDEAVERGR
ncbi:MAG: MarR family transcriptional regulator [bacterium]|nr:MarR family transcriptional regulator [bacterium]